MTTAKPPDKGRELLRLEDQDPYTRLLIQSIVRGRRNAAERKKASSGNEAPPNPRPRDGMR